MAASSRARPPDAARSPVTLSGDGLIGAVAGALREVPGAVLGVLPGGRGNDFARMLGLPLDAVAACDVLAHGRAAPVDMGDADGRTFLGIASLGFDSDANRIANAAPPPARAAGLRLRRAARPRGVEARAVHGRRSTATSAQFRRVERGRGELGLLRWRDAPRPPRPARRRRARRDPHRRVLEARATSATLPKVFHGAHVREPMVDELRGRRAAGERRPPVHRLRRRRPDRQPAHHAARASRRRCGSCCRA